MKKVFSNASDVIHLFAQRTQDEGRCRNVFFYGDKIYSYGHHYELARFIDDKAIWINDLGYSSTTSSHINAVKYATRQYKQFYKSYCHIDQASFNIEAAYARLANARKPEMYVQEIVERFEKLNEYITYTKDKATPKNPKYKAIKKIYKDVSENLDAVREKLLKQKEANKKKIAKILKERLAKFYAYEVREVRVGDEDYLRISKDKEFVETTQGVKVTVGDAKKLYQSILAGKDIKGEYIGSYRVTSLNGVLKIGCHSINVKNMHEIGKQLLNF